MRKRIFRLLKLPPRLVYSLGLGLFLGRFVLLLTTRGRRSGKARVTPLQYERVDGALVVASARGARSDWYRNLLADPRAEVRVGRTRFTARAEMCTDPARIADFLDLRLERHPRMVEWILRLRGVPSQPSRSDLEAYAAGLAMVTLNPSDASSE